MHGRTLPLVGCRGRITTYGYPSDPTPDSNSARGIGAWDNLLGPLSVALSRDVEAVLRKAGLRPRGRMILVLEDGRELLRRWDDRTARTYQGRALRGRYDLYCPSGRNPLEDQRVTGVRILVVEAISGGNLNGGGDLQQPYTKLSILGCPGR